MARPLTQVASNSTFGACTVRDGVSRTCRVSSSTWTSPDGQPVVSASQAVSGARAWPSSPYCSVQSVPAGWSCMTRLYSLDGLLALDHSPGSGNQLIYMLLYPIGPPASVRTKCPSQATTDEFPRSYRHDRLGHSPRHPLVPTQHPLRCTHPNGHRHQNRDRADRRPLPTTISTTLTSFSLHARASGARPTSIDCT